MIRTTVSNKYSIVFAVALLLSLHSEAQLSIDSCYKSAERNYPLIKKAGLILQSEIYSIANISKGYLPQVSISGQATYQSEVTSVTGIPGISIEPLSKDQYKTIADVSETVYDGGVIKTQKQIQRTSSAIETANLQKDLYDIKERINQLFFGALLLKIQLEQNNILIKELQNTKQRVDSSVNNGAAYRSDADQLQSEILIQQQHEYDLQYGIYSYLQMLQAFTAIKIDSVEQLKYPTPIVTNWSDTANNRPELKVFSLQKKLYNQQVNLLYSKTKPKFSLFSEGGYGRPGLNQLKNKFDWFYIAGIKLNWNFSSLYTLQNDKKLLQNNISETNVQRETFLFNNNLTLVQQDNEEQKTRKLMQTDQEIITLKESIRKSAKAKYENGVITLNDYLKEINGVNQAALNFELHKIQSLSNQYNRLVTLGN